MTTGCASNFKVVHPVVTDRNRSYRQSGNCATNGTTNRMFAQSVARQVARLVSPRSCTIDSKTLHDWSHDHVRPVCDLLWFMIAGPEFWTWPSTLLRPNLVVRSPTTLWLIARLVSNLSAIHLILWPYIGHNMITSPVRLGINSSPPRAAYMRQWFGSALVQIMACCLFSAKPLSKPMLDYLRNKLQWNFNQNINLFIHEIASENIVCEMVAVQLGHTSFVPYRETSWFF